MNNPEITPPSNSNHFRDGAAVFLGQSMTEEGEPRVLATIAGVLILGVIGNGLTQLNVDSYVRDVLTGLIVVAAVAVSSYGKTRAR